MTLDMDIVDEIPGGARLDHSPYKDAALANPGKWIHLPWPERDNYSLSKTYRKCGFTAHVRDGQVYIQARPEL
jgi:hypothetical protein